MKKVIRSSLQHVPDDKIGTYTQPGIDQILQYLGFIFQENPSIALMYDPADKHTVIVYDADDDGSLKKYEDVVVDGDASEFLSVLNDRVALDQYLADNDIHVVPMTLEKIVF